MNSLTHWIKASTQAKTINDDLLYNKQKQLVRINSLNQLRTVVQSNKNKIDYKTSTVSPYRQLTPFLKTGYVYNFKKVFSSFRSVITDQARREQYEQNELETVTIKAILKGQRLYKKNLQRWEPTRVLKNMRHRAGSPGQLTSVAPSDKQTSATLPRRTALLSRYELKRVQLKAFIKPHGTVTRVRNRCVISGRSSIVGSTGLSRISFRQRAGLGKIPGLLKI